nr:hypothetical protein [Corynebacterium stationis]
MPPMQMGGVALDLSVLVLFIILQLLQLIVRGVFIG